TYVAIDSLLALRARLGRRAPAPRRPAARTTVVPKSRAATRSVHGEGSLRYSAARGRSSPRGVRHENGRDIQGEAYEAGRPGRAHHGGGERYGAERSHDLRERRRKGGRRGCHGVRGASGRREDRGRRWTGAVREARRDERGGLGGGL